MFKLGNVSTKNTELRIEKHAEDLEYEHRFIMLTILLKRYFFSFKPALGLQLEYFLNLFSVLSSN